MKISNLIAILILSVSAGLLGTCAAPATVPATPVAQVAATNTVAPSNTPAPTDTLIPPTATHTAVPPTATSTRTATATATSTHTATFTVAPSETPTQVPPTPTRVPATRKPATPKPSPAVPPDQAGFLIQNRSGVLIIIRIATVTRGEPQEFVLEPNGEVFVTTSMRLLVWVVKFPDSDFVPGGLAVMQQGQLKTLKIYKQPGGNCFQPECYEYIPPNS